MNSINQYGNSLIVPYGQNGYSPYFFGKANYNAQPNEAPTNNLLWVQGVEIINEQNKKRTNLFKNI